MIERPSIRSAICTAALLSFGVSAPGHADDENGFRTLGSPMQAYEPNLFGYTHASGDVDFVDFTLSVKYPLLPNLTDRHWTPENRLYLAFTGRFAFYYDTRDSSPVIVKRLNPKLFFEHIFVDGAPDRLSSDGSGRQGRPQEPKTYVTFAYAHESNGQSIDTLKEYDQAVANESNAGAAIDYVSRGWDYLELNGRNVLSESARYRWSMTGSAKDFLSNGLFQGHPEEVWSWEPTSQGKPRDEVDGLTIRSKLEGVRGGSGAIRASELSVAYTTGYHDVGRYTTLRIEAGVQAFEIPLILWCSRGYMSDLARYYLNVTSCGVALAIAGF